MYWEEPIFVSDAFSIKTDESLLQIKYIYHFLLQNQQKIHAMKKGSGVPHVYPKDIGTLMIPIPPLSVQTEIVKILDALTALTSELTSELILRRKQYEYYREKLLSFDSLEQLNMGGAKKKLIDVCINIFSGKNKERNDSGLYPIYGSTGIIGKTNKKEFSNEQILVARVGANAGYVHIAQGEYDVSDNTLIVQNNKNIDLKFLYHTLVNMNLNQYAKGAGQPLITAGQLKSMEINVPPLKEQHRIVSILDKFETLTNSITEGLPLAIKQSQKRYEYYRELLLNFE